MTDTPIDTPAPEPVVEPQAADTPAVEAPESRSDVTSDFSLPDEYKDKPWAAKIKSHDDAYKQIDNLNTLVGKKTLQPLDYTTATSEEIAAHHNSLAPENILDYGLSQEDDSLDFSTFLGETYKEAGLTPHQAKLLNEKVTTKTVEMEAARTAAAADGGEYLKMLDASFGDGKGENIGKMLDGKITEYANKADVALLRDGIPNNTRLALDRILYNILDKHGANESGSQVEGDAGSTSTVSVEDSRRDIRKQLRDIEGKPFVGERKAELINKLNSLYK